jgi:hypothetical protein
MSFESWHEVNLVFFLCPSTFEFLELVFMPFFYVGLFHSYAYNYKVNMLIWVNSNHSNLILFFQFNWRHFFISNFALLFFSVYLICSQSPQFSPHSHEYMFQKFTRVDFYFLSFFNYFFLISLLIFYFFSHLIFYGIKYLNFI